MPKAGNGSRREAAAKVGRRGGKAQDRPAGPVLAARSARRPMDRKVLCREDLGPCVLLPKTHWACLPAHGRAAVTVNGKTCRVSVHAEQCTCGGHPVHEHRYLRLARGFLATQRVTIAL